MTDTTSAPTSHRGRGRLRRRSLLKLGVAGGAVAAAPQLLWPPSADAATLLVGTGYASKFTTALPLPARIDLSGTTTAATVTASGFSKTILTGYPATNVYGYNASSPGPTIIGAASKTANVTWVNSLPTGSLTLAQGGHLLPVDATLLEADMAALPAGQKPMVTHLHGSHAEWQSDGHAEAWATQNGTKGSFWQKSTYVYDNTQVSGTLWYHDHSMGITRLNAYAGMAGMYLLRDSVETALVSSGVLPASAYEQELVLQDRWFTDDGQLFLATTTTPVGGIEPTIFPDFVLVNGAPWPIMQVEPRKYRFRVLNASDSRMFVLTLSTNASFLVVGSDQGLLPNAVAVTRLLMAPGERYDLVVDFTGLAKNTAVTLNNKGVDNVLQGFKSNGVITNLVKDTAFGGTIANTSSTGKVMRFKVSKTLSTTANATVVAGTKLAGPIPALTATKTRQVMTYFGKDGTGRGMEMLGSIPEGTNMWMDPGTENVATGTTEIWEIYNCGPVAHPIHIHLVNFQVLDRASFTFTATTKAMGSEGTGATIAIKTTGTRRSPEAYEVGRKDLVVCYPNEVTRVIANFDRAGNYVWHCHILHHEDHGMMRPVTVA